MPALHCRVCLTEFGDEAAIATATVRSNVRRFRGESFAVWRCPGCGSIHARDAVDLPYYYRHYPFHNQKASRIASLFYDRLLGRLVGCGLRREHAVLDYGCGGGLFVEHLRARGYGRAEGYDAFSERYADRALLERSWDCVFAQDVLEHVEDPWAFLAELGRLAAPGGLIALGTPNAEAIDLADPEASLHALHQPYHRTIFSKSALLAAGERSGWGLVRYYRHPYADTWIPLLNARTWFRYSRSLDNTIDLAFERPRLTRAMLTPGAIVDAFFGSLRCRELDVMAVFRRPG